MPLPVAVVREELHPVGGGGDDASRIQAALDWFVFRATLSQAVGALDYTLLQPVAEGRP